MHLCMVLIRVEGCVWVMCAPVLQWKMYMSVLLFYLYAKDIRLFHWNLKH